MLLFLKVFPVLMIFVNYWNASRMKKKAQSWIQEDPALEGPLTKVFQGYFRYLSVPWVVMLMGIVFGRIPTGFHYFYIGDMNPYIITFWVVYFCMWFIGFIWINFRGGAEFLLTYYFPIGSKSAQKSFSSTLVNTPVGIKAIYSLSIIGVFFALAIGFIAGSSGAFEIFNNFP